MRRLFRRDDRRAGQPPRLYTRATTGRRLRLGLLGGALLLAAAALAGPYVAVASAGALLGALLALPVLGRLAPATEGGGLARRLARILVAGATVAVGGFISCMACCASPTHRPRRCCCSPGHSACPRYWRWPCSCCAGWAHTGPREAIAPAGPATLERHRYQHAATLGAAQEDLDAVVRAARDQEPKRLADHRAGERVVPVMFLGFHAADADEGRDDLRRQ